MSTDVLGYLTKRAGGQIKKAGGTEVNLPCFFCNEPSGKRGRLYVNVDPDADIPGLFECKLCDMHGAFPTIMRHFGDQPEKGNREEDNWTERREVLADAAAFYYQEIGDNPEVYHWLRGPERGLTFETITKYQIGYAPEEGGLLKHLRDKGHRTEDILKTGLVVDYSGRLQDSFREMVTIPYFVAGNVVMIRGRKWPYEGSGSKYKTPGGQTTRLYNSDAVWDAKELIITEGEFDALMLMQHGFTNVVACPGANVWQDSWDGYTAQTRRIYTVFDNDEAGAKGEAKLIERFGKKVRPIVLSENGKCDPTQWFAQGHTADDFKDLISAASGGGLLITVDEAEREHFGLQGLEGVRFGITKLDVAIAPGLLPSQVMVLLAKAGTGKTVFLLNMFQRVLMQPGQENFKMLFISLEQTRGDWFERARRIWRFYNLDGDDREFMDFWREHFLIVDKNRLSQDEFLMVLDDFEDRMGQLPNLTAIDYLGYWAQGFKGERYERTSDAIMSLKEVAKDRRIAIVTPHQVSRIAKYGAEPDVDAARDAGVVEETADFLFTMWSPDNALGKAQDQKEGIVNMRIGKSRHGGRGVMVAFHFSPLTLTLVPEGTLLSHIQQAEAELKFEKAGLTWEDACYRHRHGIRSGDLEAAPPRQISAPPPIALPPSTLQYKDD